MWYSMIFLDLYTNILEKYLITNDISEKQVTKAIEHMHNVYRSSKEFPKDSNILIDYNKVAYQCAYLHKYAAFHTALVYEIMSLALVHCPSLRTTLLCPSLRTTLVSVKEPLNICSIGCGPGTDAIGALAAIHDKLDFMQINVQLIDIVPGWEKTFKSVLEELKSKNIYGNLSKSTSKKYFDWSFLAADLQKETDTELDGKLGRADLITLVKFISAADSKIASKMIKKIFGLMKPGALVLFIDNAVGKFRNMISAAASEHDMVSVFGPLWRELYVNKTFFRERFGYKSCFQTRVSVHFFIKSKNLVQFSNEMPRFQSNMLGLQSVFWPEHQSENINMSFNDIDLRNQSFGCESPRYGPAIHFNPYLSLEPGYRFRNECSFANNSIPWEENNNFEFRNNYVQRYPSGFEPTMRSPILPTPNSFISPNSFQHRFNHESNIGNFTVSVENGFGSIQSPYFSPGVPFHSSSPLPYQTQRAFEFRNMNSDYLSFQRNSFTNESPLYNSSTNKSNYYSSPDSFSYGPQDESKIQDISVSQIDNYSAFRGNLFDDPSQNSSGYESLISSNTPCTNRRPLTDIHNIINRRDSFKSDDYLQSPGPIRKRSKSIRKRRKKQKPYLKH